MLQKASEHIVIMCLERRNNKQMAASPASGHIRLFGCQPFKHIVKTRKKLNEYNGPKKSERNPFSPHTPVCQYLSRRRRREWKDCYPLIFLPTIFIIIALIIQQNDGWCAERRHEKCCVHIFAIRSSSRNGKAGEINKTKEKTVSTPRYIMPSDFFFGCAEMEWRKKKELYQRGAHFVCGRKCVQHSTAAPSQGSHTWAMGGDGGDTKPIFFCPLPFAIHRQRISRA